jgi:hypothetical protein
MDRFGSLRRVALGMLAQRALLKEVGAAAVRKHAKFVVELGPKMPHARACSHYAQGLDDECEGEEAEEQDIEFLEA